MSEQFPIQRAVVTGGAGFIGSHVAETLLSRGTDVLVIDDFSSGTLENIALIESATRRQVHLASCDIASPDALSAIVDFSPQVVFHLAAQANVRHSVKDPVFDSHTNVLGTINLLEAARIADVQTFVLSSTGGAVYGEQENFPADENHRTAAECPYGVSKRCAELYVEYYARIYGIKCRILRYSNVYGPRQNPKGEAGVIAIFIDRLKAKASLLVNGDGEQTRDFVYVGDVVAANLLSATTMGIAQCATFNVGSQTELSVNQLVAALSRVWKSMVSSSPEIEVIYGPVLPGEQRRSVIATGKIERELGWRAQVQFDDGLRATIEQSLSSSAAK